MKSFFFTLLFLLISFNSYAADEWDKEDYVLASTFTVATIVDWGQTRDIIKRHNEGYYEKNTTLGDNPSAWDIDTYMGSTIIASGVLAYFLPKTPRKVFLYLITSLRLNTIYNNHRIGLRVNF